MLCRMDMKHHCHALLFSLKERSEMRYTSKQNNVGFFLIHLAIQNTSSNLCKDCPMLNVWQSRCETNLKLSWCCLGQWTLTNIQKRQTSTYPLYPNPWWMKILIFIDRIPDHFLSSSKIIWNCTDIPIMLGVLRLGTEESSGGAVLLVSKPTSNKSVFM